MSAYWHIATPAGASGALAILHMGAASGAELDAAMAAIGLRAGPAGAVVLRSIAGVDRGIVARVGERSAMLMPHAGRAVMERLVGELRAAGIEECSHVPAGELYPEARSGVEAMALAALSRAASPMAVNLLLAQHRLWSMPGAQSDPARDRVLNRLIEPAMVVAVGGANIGKSSLLNALAGRSVAVVADMPGTTRDHVGAMLDLAGLVVCFVDTPGLRDTRDEIELAARACALEVAARADLLLLCADATADYPVAPGGAPGLRVGLRRDLGPAPSAPDVETAATRGEGLADLVAAIRERLVPRRAIEAPIPWRFWDGAHQTP